MSSAASEPTNNSPSLEEHREKAEQLIEEIEGHSSQWHGDGPICPAMEPLETMTRMLRELVKDCTDAEKFGETVASVGQLYRKVTEEACLELKRQFEEEQRLEKAKLASLMLNRDSDTDDTKKRKRDRGDVD
jgi:hypothetical protein